MQVRNESGLFCLCCLRFPCNGVTCGLSLLPSPQERAASAGSGRLLDQPHILWHKGVQGGALEGHSPAVVAAAAAPAGEGEWDTRASMQVRLWLVGSQHRTKEHSPAVPAKSQQHSPEPATMHANALTPDLCSSVEPLHSHRDAVTCQRSWSTSTPACRTPTPSCPWAPPPPHSGPAAAAAQSPPPAPVAHCPHSPPSPVIWALPSAPLGGSRPPTPQAPPPRLQAPPAAAPSSARPTWRVCRSLR
jgi:hypothetical protein